MLACAEELVEATELMLRKGWSADITRPGNGAYCVAYRCFDLVCRSGSFGYKKYRPKQNLDYNLRIKWYPQPYSVRRTYILVLAQVNNPRLFRYDKLNLSSDHFPVTPPSPYLRSSYPRLGHHFPRLVSSELRTHAEGDVQIHSRYHLRQRSATSAL